MKVFDIDTLQQVNQGIRSGTPGFQPKFTVGNYFIKQQCFMGNQLRNDYKVEVFASRLGDILNIPVLHQETCKINYHNYTCYGAVSPNLVTTKQAKFCSFRYLMARKQIDVDEDKMRTLDAIDKLKYISSLYNMALKIPESVAEEYMVNTALIDILVCNTDRHTRNFGAWCTTNNRISLYPIFDNGLGFGQWVDDPKYYNTYEDYMRTAYIAPYGEDPFVMLELLDGAYAVKRKKLRPKYKDLSALGRMGFPCEFAKQYYHNILKAIKE